MRYRCWVPDYGHVPEEGDGEIISINYGTSEEAAEKYLQRKFADWDYPTEMEIAVVELGVDDCMLGAPRFFSVEVESVPHFSASEIKAPKVPA